MIKNQTRIPILRGSENFKQWYNYICREISENGLSEYIKENKIRDLNVDSNLWSEEDKTVLSNNASVRIMIIHTITNAVHRKIVGIESVYDIMELIKKMYGSTDIEKDLLYWITKLDSLSAKNERQIMSVIRQMKTIFTRMQENQFNLSEKEKIKYLISSIPKSYSLKIFLKNDDTFDSLYQQIVEDLSMMAYVYDWKDNEDEDDEDDDDSVENVHSKRRSLMDKDYQRSTTSYNKKYCGICKKTNHDTKDCWYNLKSKNCRYKNFYEEIKHNHSQNSKNYNNSNNNNNKPYKSHSKMVYTVFH